ncbi:MAG: MalY/PatB family protein [Christensenella sp.]|nr:MalY/PatB family protein [Christensenella sp.]
MKYDFEHYIARDQSGSVKWAEMHRKNPDVTDSIVPFSVADMEFRTAPEIITGLQKYLETAVLGYTEATDSYFDAVTEWMRRRHVWEVKKEWIVPTPGVVAALGVAVNAYTKPGDGVIIMTPVYYPFYLVIEKSGRTIVENPLRETDGHYEIDFDDLERKAAQQDSKMLILCSPHNPVGRVWTPGELARIGEICEKYALVPVIDEIHHDLIMPGYRHTVFPNACKSLAQQCVVCTAPSKTFNLAGMQTSNIVIPDENMRKKFIRVKQSAAMLELNVLGYRACEIAYRECETWLNELIAVLDQNRAMVEDFCARNLPGVRVTRLEGTYLQWLDFRSAELSEKKLEELMTQQAQVFFDEGYIFGSAGSGFERLNIACPKYILEAGLLRVQKAIKPYL